MTVASPSKWSIPAHIRLQWRSWGEETIVYHCQSGDVHLLNPVAVAVLEILQKESMTEADLQSRALEVLGLESSDSLSHNIKSLLHQLDELGLIWPG